MKKPLFSLFFSSLSSLSVLFTDFVPIYQIISRLVCCDANNNSDPSKELAAVKEGLTNTIESVSRVAS